MRLQRRSSLPHRLCCSGTCFILPFPLCDPLPRSGGNLRVELFDYRVRLYDSACGLLEQVLCFRLNVFGVLLHLDLVDVDPHALYTNISAILFTHLVDQLLRHLLGDRDLNVRHLAFLKDVFCVLNQNDVVLSRVETGGYTAICESLVKEVFPVTTRSLAVVDNQTLEDFLRREALEGHALGPGFVN